MRYARLDYKTYLENANGSYVERIGSVFSSFLPSIIGLNNGNYILPQASDVFAKETNYTIVGNLEESRIESMTKDSLEITPTLTISDQGTYSITYYWKGRLTASPLTNYGYYTYTFSAVYNRLPLKKWTITDVICRCCDTLESLSPNETARFRFQGVIYDTNGNVTGYQTGSQAEKFNEILAPEFAFTKMTFREQMQQVGGFIHGEPRVIDIGFDRNGKSFFIFNFDMYGNNTKSNISKKHRITSTSKTNINEYCTALDSSVENIVSQLDWAIGAIHEPTNGVNNFVGAYGITLRTERTTARMAENDSTFVPTTKPIYQVGEDFKVICTYIPYIGAGWWDITPYIFEKADYDNLSSYDGIYPFSKSYALYYTQGEKNIKGLFYKVENAITQALENYAIKNILEAVTGETINLSATDIMALAFNVTYLSISSARVKTNKQLTIGGFPRSLAYNQNANLIETRFYGENLKGVVERLGNTEKSYTYAVAYISQIPKEGTKFDDDYWISSVAVEFLPTYIKVTVGLSKHFNRLSEYVSISSYKRMWEISEKQSVLREMNVSEYVMINSNPNETTDSGIMLNANIADNFPVYLFSALLFNRYNIDCAFASFYYKNGNAIHDYGVTLPVTTVAMGNSIVFTFGFADNYSAGQRIVYVNDKTQPNKDDYITGYWGEYVPYTDYYGRIHELRFALMSDTKNYTDINGALDYPLYNSYVLTNDTKTVFEKALKIRKDNREVPQISVEVMFVTDDKSIIIGSAISRNNAFVNPNVKSVALYGLYSQISVVDGKLDLSASNATLITSNFYNVSGKQITLPNDNRPFVAWALVTPVSEEVFDVATEDGTETTQTISTGGELVLGQNAPLSGQSLYFNVKRNIYD